MVNRLAIEEPIALLVYKDETSATNQRTMIASFVPFNGVVNSAPVILTSSSLTDFRLQSCLLANLNCLPLDFVARQKVGGVHLKFFIVEQLPVLPPDRYEQSCPWNKKKLLKDWVSERVLKLSCTSESMRPLADAAAFSEGVHKWDPAERADLMAELDAAFFLLYGLNRPQVEYVLSTFQGLRSNESGLFGNSGPIDRILDYYDHLRAG